MRSPHLGPLAAFLLEFLAAMYSIDGCMVDHHSGAPQGRKPRGILFRTDHKAIGLLYLWLALFSVFLGMMMSLVMRMHLVWPGAHLPMLPGFGNSPERYAALTQSDLSTLEHFLGR